MSAYISTMIWLESYLFDNFSSKRGKLARVCTDGCKIKVHRVCSASFLGTQSNTCLYIAQILFVDLTCTCFKLSNMIPISSVISSPHQLGNSPQVSYSTILVCGYSETCTNSNRVLSILIMCQLNIT